MKKAIEAILSEYRLKDSVSIKVANVTKYDDNQVEIRDAVSGLLIWRAWDFEPGFYDDFRKELKRHVV